MCHVSYFFFNIAFTLVWNKVIHVKRFLHHFFWPYMEFCTGWILLSYYICHCEMKGKSSMLLSPEFKNMLFYVVFNAELNCTIRILCFHCAIIGLLCPSCALLGHSRSIMEQWKHKILTVPFNSALKTT